MNNLENKNVIDKFNNKELNNENNLDNNLDSNLDKNKHYVNSKKFLKLIEEFDTSAEGMEQELQKERNEIIAKVKDEEIQLNEEQQSNLIKSEELLNDFSLVREALREDIKSTKLLIEKLSQDMLLMDGEEISGSLVQAFAELKKGNVTSMKLLMDTYSNVAETQLKIKKFLKEQEKISEEKFSNTTNIQINSFEGTMTDLLKTIK